MTVFPFLLKSQNKFFDLYYYTLLIIRLYVVELRWLVLFFVIFFF